MAALKSHTAFSTGCLAGRSVSAHGSRQRHTALTPSPSFRRQLIWSSKFTSYGPVVVVANPKPFRLRPSDPPDAGGTHIALELPYRDIIDRPTGRPADLVAHPTTTGHGLASPGQWTTRREERSRRRRGRALKGPFPSREFLSHLGEVVRVRF